MWRSRGGCSKITNWWHQSSRRDPVPTSACSVLENEQWNLYIFLNFAQMWLSRYSLMAACNWVVCNVECRCVAITGASIPVPCHMCRSLWLGWGLGTRWCVQRVPDHRLGCGDQEMGCGVVALVVPGGRHAPLHWNSYCAHELAHNTLLFLFVVFFTNNCCFSIKVCHVLLCMSRNTGQINPAGFQSLKYMYYTHVIMTIKWFLTLTFEKYMILESWNL